MKETRRTYKNAGAQTDQGEIDALRFWSADAGDFFTVKGISLVLDINRNAVVKIPVRRYLIDKRAYYRKGDIENWIELDLSSSESLLQQLQLQQRNAEKRLRKHKSRIYTSGNQSPSEARASKAASKENLARKVARTKARE